MKKSKIRLLLVLLVVLSLVFTTACGNKGGGEATGGDKVLKVAFCMPLTGESAKAAQEQKDTVVMALEDLGGKVGDYTIEPIYVDVTTDPEKGALALEQAIIKDGAQVAMLGWNSSVVMSLMDVAAKYQIPYFFDHGGMSGAVDDKYKSDPKYSYFIAKGAPRPELLAANSYINVISEAIADGTLKPANQNIAFYGDDTDWGRSIVGAIRDSFTAKGWTQVYEDYFQMGTTDFYAVLSKIKAQNPSIIAGTISSPASAAAFLKQARELNINAVIICDALSENADYYSLTGDSANYVLDNRPVWSTDAGNAFKDAFKTKYGYEPTPFNGGQIWDYMHFFAQICQGTIDTAGTLDSKTLYTYATEQLMTGKISYTDGIVIPNYTFTAESAPGPVVGDGYYTFPVLQFKGDKINAVWPSNMATTKFEAPAAQ